MARKCLTRCSTSLMAHEMQIKTTRYRRTPARTAVVNKPTNERAGEMHCGAGTRAGRPLWGAARGLLGDWTRTYGPAAPLLGTRLKNTSSEGRLPPRAHRRVVCSSRATAAARAPAGGQWVRSVRCRRAIYDDLAAGKGGNLAVCDTEGGPGRERGEWSRTGGDKQHPASRTRGTHGNSTHNHADARTDCGCAGEEGLDGGGRSATCGHGNVTGRRPGTGSAAGGVPLRRRARGAVR